MIDPATQSARKRQKALADEHNAISQLIKSLDTANEQLEMKKTSTAKVEKKTRAAVTAAQKVFDEAKATLDKAQEEADNLEEKTKAELEAVEDEVKGLKEKLAVYDNTTEEEEV